MQLNAYILTVAAAMSLNVATAVPVTQYSGSSAGIVGTARTPTTSVRGCTLPDGKSLSHGFRANYNGCDCSCNSGTLVWANGCNVNAATTAPSNGVGADGRGNVYAQFGSATANNNNKAGGSTVFGWGTRTDGRGYNDNKVNGQGDVNGFRSIDGSARALQGKTIGTNGGARADGSLKRPALGRPNNGTRRTGDWAKVNGTRGYINGTDGRGCQMPDGRSLPNGRRGRVNTCICRCNNGSLEWDSNCPAGNRINSALPAPPADPVPAPMVVSQFETIAMPTATPLPVPVTASDSPTSEVVVCTLSTGLQINAGTTATVDCQVCGCSATGRLECTADPTCAADSGTADSGADGATTVANEAGSEFVDATADDSVVDESVNDVVNGEGDIVEGELDAAYVNENENDVVDVEGNFIDVSDVTDVVDGEGDIIDESVADDVVDGEGDIIDGEADAALYV